MSLLWTQAMPWWNHDDPHGYEEDLRDPEETLKQRGQRYKQKVVDNHGVRPEVAQKAIQHVVKHLDTGTVWADPTDYGFDSVSRRRPHDLIKDPDAASKIYRPDTWAHLPVQGVALDQGNMHATQDFVRHQSVAHNLFHPGKKQSSMDDEAVGDPDYDPVWDLDSHEEDEPESEKHDHLKHPRFLKTNDGKMYTLDGHHRVATDLLLGKRTTYGRVLHEKDL